MNQITSSGLMLCKTLLPAGRL